MSNQPEAAAKAAEATPDEFLFADSLPLACAPYRVQIAAAFRQAVAARDEQLAALTDKLATVAAERDALKQLHTLLSITFKCNPESLTLATKIDEALSDLSAHAATIEGLKADNESRTRERDEAQAFVDALRTRVAELERERDTERANADKWYQRFTDLATQNPTT